MFSKETFCSIPWSTAEINPDGRYKVCAFTGAGSDENPNFYKDKTGRQINVLTHSIIEGMNTNLHKQIRIAQSKKERHPSCKVCWERDDACKDNEESKIYD